MLKLMNQCQQIDENNFLHQKGDKSSTTLDNTNKKELPGTITTRGLLQNNPLTLLSGIIPGR